MPRTVLVTTGATHPFRELLRVALTPSFLNVLAENGYTHIQIQYGSCPEYDTLVNALLAHYAKSAGPPLEITGFSFSEDMRKDFVSCADLIISHAGAGSILDALRYQKRIVVVANEALMGGHQDELADEMAKLKYVVKGTLGALKQAVRKAEEFEYAQFPQTKPKEFVRLVEGEMGLSTLELGIE